jgi:KDO2-lipid IV(A) lauroyltransferase
VSVIPNRWLSNIAGIVTILAKAFARKEGRILDENIMRILGLPRHSRYAHLFRNQVIRSQMQIALETIKAIARPDSVEFLGLDEMKAAMKAMEAQGKGQIMVSGHIGSWELIADKSADLSTTQYNALAKPARYEFVTKALGWQRQRMKVNILWTDQKTIVRQMLKALHNKEWLSFVMDQKPQGRQGPEVVFFDRKLAFVGGPAAMSLKTGSPILVVFCVRVGPAKYRMITRAIDLDAAEKTPAAISQLLATEIERAIKLFPEQWCWNYKRWIFTSEAST